MINNIFSNLNNNLLKILNGFTVLFGLIILAIFIRQGIEGYSKESWQITEWLINYKAGFVRRGLPGQLIFDAYRVFNIDAYFLIIAICALCYICVCFLIIRAAHRRKFPFILLPSAYVLGGPVINDFWVRKDVFLILCFIGVIYMLRKKGLVALFIINVLCTIAVLCHETFGIWAFPALILSHYICLSPRNAEFNFNGFLSSFLCFLPAIFVFFTCIYFKGNAIVGEEIWNSWLPVQFPYNGGGFTVPPGSIEPLSWDLYKGITNYSYLIFINSYGIYVPIGLLLSVIAVYLIVSFTPVIYQRLESKLSTTGRPSIDYLLQGRILSRWLLIQFIVIVPLFILGIDYGRWIFIGITTSIVLFLFIPHEANIKLLELVAIKNTNAFLSIILKLTKFKNILNQYALNSKYSVILYLVGYCFIGVSIVSWDLRTFLLSSPFGSFYQFIYLLSHGTLYKMFG